MFKILQRFLRTLIVIVLGTFSLFFLGVAWYIFGVHIESRSIEPKTAFWMEHSWSTGTENDFYILSTKAEEYKITDLFFHVGPISEDGSLAEDLNIFTPGFEALPTTNYAWIGQVRSKINLDDPEIRQNIIESSEWILSKGFDGIHLDIEPVRSEDESFFLLLEELRAALPDTKISVAMDEWQPHFISQVISWLDNTTIESYWTKSQIKRTAELADQIVVMTYDAGFKDPKLYTWWVEQQTIALSHFTKGPEIFIGIPSYTENIDPNAENIQTGIAGFHNAVQNIRTNLDNLKGIAIYAYWEMGRDEWAQLREL